MFCAFLVGKECLKTIAISNLSNPVTFWIMQNIINAECSCLKDLAQIAFKICSAYLSLVSTNHRTAKICEKIGAKFGFSWESDFFLEPSSIPANSIGCDRQTKKSAPNSASLGAILFQHCCAWDCLKSRKNAPTANPHWSNQFGWPGLSGLFESDWPEKFRGIFSKSCEKQKILTRQFFGSSCSAHKNENIFSKNSPAWPSCKWEKNTTGSQKDIFISTFSPSFSLFLTPVSLSHTVSRPVWPDLANFRHFGSNFWKSLTIFI